MWLYMTESLVKCTLISDRALLKSAWHTPGKRERDPAWLASHIKVRDARGNEGGDRDIQSEGRLSQRCSNTQRPLSLATASTRECRMRLEWKWTTDCPRKKHKDKETREHWLTLSLHYYLQKLCWTFETFSDKCQIFSDHRKQDFFALLK